MFEQLEFPHSLGSDNHSGVHPKIVSALLAANRGHAHAYGMDAVCELAATEFKRVFGPHASVEYVFTGTAANVLSLAPTAKSFEAVICADMAHLNMDECGAPEKFLGAKLWTLASEDGRIFPEQTTELFERMGDQHFSQPRVVSLTLPSELGVCYSLAELRAWSKFCRKKNLMLHFDGARFANALVHLNCSAKDLAELADVISFGGTKNGLMGAEAIVFLHDSARQNFKFLRKQAMQLSSKTRFLAAQFYAYLKDDLYLQIAQHVHDQAVSMAAQLRDVPEIQLAYPVHSNGLFVRVPKEWIKPLREKMFFYIWDNQTQLCRWMISWDWNEELTNNWLKTIQEVKRCFPKE
jgi:threonine aldolase